MRLATILDDAGPFVALVRDDTYLPAAPDGDRLASMQALAGSPRAVLDRLRAWADDQPERAYRPLAGTRLAPVVPDPGAIFTIGLNYATPGETTEARLDRPLVYGKLPSSVAAHSETLRWDRSLTRNVDAEVELGVVIGETARGVAVDEAMRHVFGYTCVNDVSSRDAWLDGDQWLLGKSMPGFCPVGPWIVTADAFDPSDVRLGCMINGQPIQDGRTSQMRFSIAEVMSYIGRHVDLRPGDVIATGTPARLASPPGPDRHLDRRDVVTCWIDGIGELTNTIA